MTTVFVRIWPDRPQKGMRGVEKSITQSGPIPLEDEFLYIEDLGREVLVYRVPEPITPGYEAELRLVVPPEEILLLREKGWVEYDAPETKCLHC